METKNPLNNLTQEQDQLIRLLASRYLRQENRFYHIDQPNQSLSRREVKQTFMNAVRRELPHIPLTSETLKTVFKVGIQLQHTSQEHTVPEGCIVTDTTTVKKVRFNGQQFAAYRFIFCALNREVVGYDDVIRHRCHNRLCINPEHLQRGSRPDNKHDDRENWANGVDHRYL